MLNSSFRGFLSAVVVATTLVMAIPTDAEACDYLGDWEFAKAIPEDGAEVSPEVQFSVWRTGPVRSEPRFELTDGDGETVSISMETNIVGANTKDAVEQTVVIPDSSLTAGSTYTLVATVEEKRVDVTGQVTDVKTRQLSLSVDIVEADVETPSSVGGVEWTSAAARGTSCHMTRVQWHEVNIEANAFSDDVWFEIRYFSDDQSIAVIGQPTTEPVRHTLDAEANCIAVTAVGMDGSRSETTRSCEPDICQVDAGFDEVQQIRCDHERPTRLPEP